MTSHVPPCPAEKLLPSLPSLVRHRSCPNVLDFSVPSTVQSPTNRASPRNLPAKYACALRQIAAPQAVSWWGTVLDSRDRCQTTDERRRYPESASIGAPRLLLSLPSPQEDGVVVPFEELLVGPVGHPRREPQLGTLHREVLLAVVELLAEAAAGSELVVRRDRDVATVEQRVDV